MGFWKRVEAEMNYQGISRKELAAMADISYSGIGLGIERDSMPGADIALRISRSLNVPLEELLGERPGPDKNGSESKLPVYSFETLRVDIESLPIDIRDSFFFSISKVANALRAK